MRKTSWRAERLGWRPMAAGFTVALVAAALPATATSVSAATPALGRLDRVVAEFAAELGMPASPTAVGDAGLSEIVADRMAALLEALLECHRISRAGLAAGYGAASPNGAWVEAIRACGGSALARVDGLRDVLRQDRDPGSIDAWPVLRYEPGNETNIYLHDYVLLVDAAGSDSYFNNAGGNAIDVFRGPAGSGAPTIAPARGCQTDGELGEECIVAAAAVIDLSGNDTYGRFESPQVDAICTADDVVRRIVLHGSAANGVGLLVDENGDDTYSGKVLTIGNGHVGFGHLRDISGDDSYTAVRVSIGSSVVEGYGTLADLAGDDTYNYYVPAALNPAAPNLTPGAGGVLDNQGRCDNEARTLMGGAAVGGAALLRNVGGNDSYTFPARAMGSGVLGGVGVFIDAGGGTDTYTGAAPGRADNVTLLPSAANTGLFRDS